MEPLTLFYLSCFSFFFHTFFTCTTSIDTINVNQTIRDGETIVSPEQAFELGFFSPGNNTENRYLGIWYKSLATGTVVWVANRETPIKNKFGELTLRPDGVLVLSDSSTNQAIWSSNPWRPTRNIPMARLLDSANLMVVDSEDDTDNFIWQSFDHPSDTELPEMICGRNVKRGILANYTSWKSVDDPSKGEYMIYIDFSGLPQIYQANRNGIQYRLGSWNGLAYAGSTSNEPNPYYIMNFVFNEIETYSEFDIANKSVLTRLTLSPYGSMEQYSWINGSQGWFLYGSLTTDSCERYTLCGVYGSCDFSQSPYCGCLNGFTPKRPDQWDVADWTSGCQREIPLDCTAGEGFRRYPNVKIPDTRNAWFDKNMTLEKCKVKCKNECNCTAYATLNIRYVTGCLIWYDELVDMRKLPNNGQDIYIRMAAKELEKDIRVSRSKMKTRIIVILVIVGLSILLGLCLLIVRKKNIKRQRKQSPNTQDVFDDLPVFSLSSLLIATDNFSTNNKLGEGGFGPVYKGSLENGQEIAVKRLSSSSTQGAEEFKNEAVFLSKLQHRNLVKILGCCIHGEEKMLIYEYVANKGLDSFLFEENKSKRLDWSQRFHIINGIARGLLYIHQDSQPQIIHRDLKAANILLDHEMNPKIADFGLARRFQGNEIETSTEQVVGTYGYMSPEYAKEGMFSIKSDVFSFGVLILEIVSGKKNRRSDLVGQNQNLVGHAWRLYKEGKTLELVDIYLIESCNTFEVLRSIHVGLLCVQHSPDDRPNMSKVITMLTSDNQLPEPKQPGFYMEESEC